MTRSIARGRYAPRNGYGRFARAGALKRREVLVLRSLKLANGPPHPFDCHVGRRIRLRRAQLGLSQGDLGARIGVSFQAVQKYESGSIRISASRLYEVSRALEAAPGFFFAEYPGGEAHDEGAEEAKAALDRRETLSLVRGYYGIRDRDLQSSILQLIARLGSREGAPENS